MNIATATLADRRAALQNGANKGSRIQASDIVIGKDILELISSAMYVDPMTIYREYVQNAADGIEAAREAGLISGDERGRVDIRVDPASRSITIRDNGAGIPAGQFEGRLTALGGSQKRGTKARGFRGVGRLAGLGYAQELIFRSRTAGQKTVSELRWDCRQLRTALRSVDFTGGVAELIAEITTGSLVDGTDAPARFFEVELRGIVRQRNDALMNIDAVAEYLSQVAPVPFHADFSFGEEIRQAIGDAQICELDIRVNEGKPLCRPFRNVMTAEGQPELTLRAIETIEIAGVDGGVAGVAWVAHHDYEGAVPNALHAKGLRIRAGNIQIGGHALLEELFSEQRFNSWAIGELHVLDRRVVPNGRRDDFELNIHMSNLINHMAPLARDVAKRCRTSSIRRKWLRDFEMHRTVASEKLAIAAQGALAVAERDSVAADVRGSLGRMERIAETPDLDAETVTALLEQMQSIRRGLDDLAVSDVVESPLARFEAPKREVFEQMFSLIYECSANRVAAKSLVDRILQKLS
ncbi:hypothetical protein IL54_1737 [Sphingobium sp. ba1]|uniref:ATP-binding protein n=1 Tax=Sphingobium sp. ba1 TaxID=1522072 RepID=UPI0004FF7436|nr:ATP-binding protein [Sphingobium sp. ba1]KFL46321.1 hypothetical protein IL54_1737 [Sphingobium sp. ba1]